MSVAPEGGASADGGEPAPKDGPANRPGTSLIRLPPQPRARASHRMRTVTMLWGASAVLALGLGAAGLRVALSTGTAAVTVAQVDASAQVLHRLQDEVARLKGSVDSLRVVADGARQDDSLRNLRRSVDGLKQEVEQVRSASGANLAQLSTRIDKADHDPSSKLAEIMARLDKLDHDAVGRPTDGAAQKLAEVQSRLDRVERQVSSPVVTGSIPPAVRQAATAVPVPVAASAKPPFAKAEAAPRAPAAPVPSVAAAPPVAPARTVVAKADPVPAKSAPVARWIVRDVYDGLALVQGRGGDLREVAPGEYLPGLGEVRSIERRGRSWVVLTSRGMVE